MRIRLGMGLGIGWERQQKGRRSALMPGKCGTPTAERSASRSNSTRHRPLQSSRQPAHQDLRALVRGRGPRPARARRRRSAITRRANCSPRRTRRPSRAGATARCCRPCCFTHCGATSCASSKSRTSEARGAACRISTSRARVIRRAICRFTPGPTN
jgi:hypothetical protein